MRLSLSLSAAVLALASFVRASNVVDLDPTNFEEVGLLFSPPVRRRYQER
jgi:hypothetical protein